MQILVVGAGAIGCTVAAFLSRAGYAVTLADQVPAWVSTLQAHGVTVDGTQGRIFAKPTVLSYAQLAPGQPWDLVFLCTKSTGTAAAIDLLRTTVGSTAITPAAATAGAVFVSLQNGLNEEALADAFGAERVVGAVTELSAESRGEGRVTVTSGFAGFTVGELHGAETPRVQGVADLLNHCAPARVTDNIWGHLWLKLIRNCMVNAVSGLTHITMGHVFLHDELRRVCLRLGQEGARVAAAAGVRLARFRIDLQALDEGGPEALAAAEATLREMAGGSLQSWSSLAHDLMRGVATEIDYLNGVVVQRGQSLGVATPANAEVVRLVKRVEAGEEQPGPHFVTRLAALA